MPIRTDDNEVQDNDYLLRRIWDKPGDWFNEVDGEVVVSSAAFKDALRETSVGVEREVTPQIMLADLPEHGLVKVLAENVRAENHIIAKTLEDDDPPEGYHRVITPTDPELSKKQYIKAMKRLALASEWVVYPYSVRPDPAAGNA